MLRVGGDAHIEGAVLRITVWGVVARARDLSRGSEGVVLPWRHRHRSPPLGSLAARCCAGLARPRRPALVCHTRPRPQAWLNHCRPRARVHHHPRWRGPAGSRPAGRRQEKARRECASRMHPHDRRVRHRHRRLRLPDRLLGCTGMQHHDCRTRRPSKGRSCGKHRRRGLSDRSISDWCRIFGLARRSDELGLHQADELSDLVLERTQPKLQAVWTIASRGDGVLQHAAASDTCLAQGHCAGRVRVLPPQGMADATRHLTRCLTRLPRIPSSGRARVSARRGAARVGAEREPSELHPRRLVMF
mmetsp:Transcript_30089/g.95942  ORF Transcript_30089/g.95942 Transcript_30089/m.95942 type:complete len:303 (-) Transcript_30089:5553-6461(-)